MSDNKDFQLEIVSIADLHPHSRNYQEHPDDEIEHIIASVKRHGVYKNIVAARDGTILAGHGVFKALCKMGYERIPVKRLDIDPDSSEAIKVMAGDNEIAHLAERDDRLLTELLKEVKDNDIDGLLGTGYDDMMLANLVFVTRPASEVADFDEAAEWANAGMPEYDALTPNMHVIVNFRNEEDRLQFAHILGLTFSENTRSTWWPAKDKDDCSSLRFEK